MANKDESPKNYLEVIQNFLFNIVDKPGGIICAIAAFGIVAIAFIYWKGNIDPEYFPYAIGAIIFLFLVAVICYNWHAKHSPDRKHPPEELKGRYFIGIDIGRNNIGYCLIDHNKFERREFNEVKVLHGTRKTPERLDELYSTLGDIVVEVSEEAHEKAIHPIDGIGLGLPGQVDPREGLLIKAPGFGCGGNRPFIHDLSNHIRKDLEHSLQHQHPEILKDDFPIEIDNDVRCATRYIWKREGFDDVICIFVGNGLGSGIVLGGKMLYGYNFTAGEIGHITISEGSKFLGEKKCNCGLEGGHWEMYVSSYGLINIAKNLNPNEYMRLKKGYEEIIQQEKYQILLEDKKFKDHYGKYLDNKGELTSYFFLLAFYAKEKYACEVVEIFIKYLAIGIANYLNVINPKMVYLGGGMMEAFYTDNDKAPINTKALLDKEFEKYTLPSAAKEVTIQKGIYEEIGFASIGAALIFKDQSYFEYKRREV